MHPIFNSSWWDNFLDETQTMSSPTVFKHCFHAGETRRMRMEVMEIIRDLHLNYKKKYGYRLWVNNVRIENEAEMFARAPLIGEDIKDWTDRVFKDEKFGIILNRGEKFNDDLSSFLARGIQPLIQKLGMPTEGILFTLFIGNYSATPLGIHKDSPGKSVMHFHLGPGSKTMYCWDDEKYMSSAGENCHNNMDFGPHLHYARQHTFAEGDIYFMPENHFHLGMQEGLSIGIACWWYNRSSQDFARQLLTLASRTAINRSDEMLKADPRPLSDSSGLDTTLQLFSSSVNLDMKFEVFMREAYVDLRHSLYSNCGLRNAPLPRSDRVSLDETSVVRLESPFLLYSRQTADGLTLIVYARGTRLEMRNVPSIAGVVDILNKGNSITLKKLAELSGLQIDVCRELVSTLIMYKGVDVHRAKNSDYTEAV